MNRKLADNEWVDIGLKVGIPIGIYFFVVKPILVSANLLPDKQERAQSESDKQAQNQQQQLGVYNAGDNHSYSALTIDDVAVALRNATSNWYGYDWDAIAAQLAWLPGMTVADGRYFLGTFVRKNGYTFYQWYLDKLVNAAVFSHFTWDDVQWEPGWGGTGGRAAYDYSAYYERVGITESNADTFSWSEAVNKFVSYIYSLTGVVKQ
jgi:hypothetical protein